MPGTVLETRHVSPLPGAPFSLGSQELCLPGCNRHLLTYTGGGMSNLVFGFWFCFYGCVQVFVAHMGFTLVTAAEA